MAEIYKRIQEVMDVKNIKPTTLARLLKEKVQRIQDIQSGKQRAPEDVLIKIVKTFNLNGTWLLTGQGEMYNNASMSSLKEQIVSEINEHLKVIKPEQRQEIFNRSLEMVRVNELEAKVEKLLKGRN